MAAETGKRNDTTTDLMSILETPLLLDLISDNLVEAVLCNCIRVNKRWFALFMPYRWRFVSFHEEDPPTNVSSMLPLFRQANIHTSYFDDQTKLLQQPQQQQQQPTTLQLCGHWIRRLELLSTPTTAFLDPAAHCTNLLRIKHQVDETSQSVFSLDAMKLLARNPRIQHVLLCGLNLSCPKTSAELLNLLTFDPKELEKASINTTTTTAAAEAEAVAVRTGLNQTRPSRPRSWPRLPFPNLTHLDLSSYRNVTPKLLETLLRSLPRTLRKLELALSIDEEEGLVWKAEREAEQKKGQHYNNAKEVSIQYQEEKEYLLKSIYMEGRLIGIEESFFDILRHSPDLTRLILPKVSMELASELAHILKTCCPRVKRLQTCDDYGVENNMLLMDALPELEEVELMCTHHLTGTFLEMLLLRSKTLTSIALGVQTQMASQDIQRMLMVCSNLKLLWVQSDHEEDTGRAVLDIQDMYGSEWTCLGLSDLDIMFTYEPRVEQDDGDGSSSDEKEAVKVQLAAAKKMVENVYKQLGRLTQLKSLATGWLPITSAELMFEDMMIVPYVDMSLASGLGHLHGLKALEYLDIERVLKARVSESEVEWMVLHWPRWRKLAPP
ncbi:hypothetical protein BG004_004706, partial [Podila humilis]